LIRFFVVKLVVIRRSRTSAASSGPFPTLTAAAAVKFFTEDVVVFLYESTVSSAGCRRRRVLCRPPPPVSAFGEIRSATVMRLCLPPPSFLVVVIFGTRTPTELRSSVVVPCCPAKIGSTATVAVVIPLTDPRLDLDLRRLLG
jgi:hypothetical protein